MYCIHCGQVVSDGVRFCPSCGKPIQSMPAPTDANPNFSNAYISPVEEQLSLSSAILSAVFSVLSFSALPCGIIGLILSIKSRHKVRDYRSMHGGQMNGRARAIHIISTIALPFNITGIAFCVLIYLYFLWIFVFR